MANLARVQKQPARTLFKTGVAPQQAYGAAVVGPNSIEIRKAVRNATAAAGACATALIATRIGEEFHPKVSLPLRQISLWIKLWQRAKQGNGEQAQQIRKAWSAELLKQIREAKAKDKKRLPTQPAGPIAGTIAVLRKARWKPAAPDLWIEPKGAASANLDSAPEAGAEIANFVKRSLMDETWKEAAQHFGGKGLELGTPLAEPARKQISKYRKAAAHAHANALEAIVCGGVWCGERAKKDEKEMPHVPHPR